jgi:DUF1680 family protein
LSLFALGRAFAADVAPAIKPQAEEFPLSAVKLLDGPFRHSMEVNKTFLLNIEPDRLLAGFLSQAGLPKKAEPYTGWEGIPRNGQRYTMAGHSLGHYLTSLVLMTSATGDDECRRRVDYIVSELAACQEAAGTGLLAAFPDSKAFFAEIAGGDIRTNRLFRLNDAYVPFYSMHKVMAGLRDAWLMLGHQKARDVLVRLTDSLSEVFKDLSAQQVNEVLATEHGGIMELVADVYAITGDAKYLAFAKRLNHKPVYEPLVRGQSPLDGEHANAQIPKIIGMERIYQLTGEKDYDKAAKFFWDDVVNQRTFVMGGHGANEFFFKGNEWESKGIDSNTGPETCNTYNMIKLSRQLWLIEPSVAKADYIECGLWNHILSSQDPQNGGLVYFTPMRPGHYRTYSHNTNSFWCCVGTGMENHAKYGEFIYAHAGDKLWVDLLTPSELDWADQGTKIRLDTNFPVDGKATLTFTLQEPRKLAINVRHPGWLATGAMKLAVNGAAETVDGQPGSYEVVERTWKTGDKLEIDWPLGLRTQMLPTSQQWISVLWGPIVLAGELGPDGPAPSPRGRRGPRPPDPNNPNYIAVGPAPIENTPTFRGAAADIIAKIKPTEGGRPLDFHTEGLAQPEEVKLAPFYRVHHQRYAIYWKLAE